MCRTFGNGRDDNPMILGMWSIFNYMIESVYFIFPITSILFNWISHLHLTVKEKKCYIDMTSRVTNIFGS